MASLFVRAAAGTALALLSMTTPLEARAATPQPPSPSASASAAASPAPGPTVDPSITAKAKEWLHRFQTGDMDRSQLEPSMSTALTSDVVKQLKDELAPLGDAQSFKIVSQQSLGEGATAYVYLVVFKASSIDESIAFDKAGKISGFRLTSAQ